MSEGLKNGGRVLAIHIPHEIEQHRPDIKRIVDAMVYKLHRNRHKGRWEDIDLAAGLKKLKHEIEELKEAIGNGNSLEIVSEAADIANWALILCNIALEHPEKVARRRAKAKRRPDDGSARRVEPGHALAVHPAIRDTA